MMRRLLSLLGLGLVACAGDGVEVSRPNVLLITLDTVRADHLSVTGSSKASTPVLDAIAAEGAWCSRASSASAVTPVSHASILTGRFPYNHGLRVLHAGSGFSLPEGEVTAASVFKAAGYRTGAVHSAFPVSGYFGFDQDFDHFDSFDGALQAKGDGSTGWDVRSLQRRSDETTQRALKFVAAGDEPWFLWIHYWDPHDGAMVPPPEFLEGLRYIDADGLYAVEVQYLDQQIGVLVSGLKSAGAWDDTLVAITADHGEGLQDGFQRHGWAFHRVLYQEQIHVPLLVRGPGIDPGRQVRELVRTVDVAPTLYDYAGVEGPSVDGLSLRPLLEGRADAPRIAYADQINGYDLNSKINEKRPRAAFLNSVVDWPWKLIWRPHMPAASELYDLERDPEERVNRIGERQDVAMRLLGDLVQRRPWVTEAFPDLEGGDDAAAGALGALGYAGGDEGEDDVTGPVWRWSCTTHQKVRQAASGACPRCGQPMFPVAGQ